MRSLLLFLKYDYYYQSAVIRYNKHVDLLIHSSYAACECTFAGVEWPYAGCVCTFAQCVQRI